MKKNLTLISFILLFTVFLLTSCGKHHESVPVNIPVERSSFRWFAFTDSSFIQVPRPSDAPVVPVRPWTESVRISSASCASGTDDENSVLKGYAVVNRSGILIFDGCRAELCSDSMFFSGRTAGNLVFSGDTPVFSVYRSSFFNNTESERQSEFKPFLAQFSPEQKISYPVLNVENFGFDRSYEITDFIWDGKVWTCSAKSSSEEKTKFSYFSFQLKAPMESVSPENAESSVFVTESNALQFRSAQEVRDFSSAPERLRNLLSSLPESFSFSVSCSNAGGHSPRVYTSGKTASEAGASVSSANAILSDTWSCVVFDDGTVFLKGALSGRHILNGGNTVVLKLPKLQHGFIYSYFSVSGTNLYSAWEETDFYRTGRSGFIDVDLGKILYSDREL